MQCEPRIAIVPEAVRNAGKQITQIAERAGILLDDAQQYLAAATSGVRKDGKWSAFEVVVFAPRQNLKSEFCIARLLAGLFVFGEEYQVYSAHRASTTSKIFRRLKQAIEKSPQLGARIERVSNRSGAEQIELVNGQLIECVARSTSSGRGFTGDTIILDEAQDLDSDQLAAILPMLSTRPNPQVLYCLSLGNESSTHLGALRARALARQDPHVAWIEWSMAEGDNPADREVWKRCNPAFWAGRISMDYMEREFLALGAGGAEKFARERLGKSSWPSDETGRFLVISREAWMGCSEGHHTVDRKVPLCFGVAVSRDGRSAAIASCGASTDGLPVVEVVDWRPGDGAGWVGPRMGELTRRYPADAVAWDDDSMAGQLGLASLIGRAKPVLPKPGELASACGAFFYAADQRGLRHGSDQRLTAAVGAAQMRPSRAAWYWHDRAYASEVLQAATWALHARQNRRSYNILNSIAGPTPDVSDGGWRAA